MEVNRILELLTRKMGGVASGDELAELYELIRQNPEHHYLLEVIEAIDSKRSPHNFSGSEDEIVLKNWEKLAGELGSEGTEMPGNESRFSVKRFLLRRSFRLAAVWAGAILILSVCLLTIGKQYLSSGNAATAARPQQIEIPRGVLGRQTLPDGSEVWLNSGSHIRYSGDLAQRSRDVYLEGEAYFKVKHDASHPFIVHAGDIAVKALGTEFNVQAYPDEKTIRTTLVTGKVQITMAEKPDQNIILMPNEKLTVTGSEVNTQEEEEKIGKQFRYEVEQVTKTSLATKIPELAWMQDELSFQNESFADVAKKMGRRYNVRIVFNDASLANENLTGTFKNENIGKALSLLQMTTPFRYRMRSDSVFISRGNANK